MAYDWADRGVPWDHSKAGRSLVTLSAAKGAMPAFGSLASLGMTDDRMTR